MVNKKIKKELTLEKINARLNNLAEALNYLSSAVLSWQNQDKKEFEKVAEDKKEESFESKIEEVKENKVDAFYHAIIDTASVVGIFPLLNRNCGDVDEIECSPLGLFKKINEPIITSVYNKRWDCEVMTINGSRYSKNYIDDMKKIASVWYSDIPEIYMVYDKITNEYVKDKPILFKFGVNMCFILAPRIEDD